MALQVPLIDGYIERLTPGFRDAGDSVRAFGERLITRLESIESALSDSEFEEFRETTVVRVPSDQTVIPFDSVPVGTDWELSLLTVTGGTGRILILNGSMPIVVAAQDTSLVNVGLIVKGGTDLQIQSGVGATGTLTVYAQWRVRKSKKAHRGYIGGIPQPIPDGTGDYGGPGRHAATSHIIGIDHPE